MECKCSRKNANGNIMQTWTWNVTSTPVSPSIIAFDPVSVQVNDIAGQLRTFNISLNQPVNVTWYINSVIAKDTEKSVAQATYTNTSASMGVWNVSAVAKNANGNIMQTWTWNVTSTPVSPSIIAFDPVSVQVNDIAGQLRTFNISLNQPVNVTWYLNSVIVKDTEKSVTQATYTNTSASMGVWNVSAVAKNANGNIMQTWTWNVTSTPVSPSIIAFDPVSVQVNDIAGQLRTFNISLNQPVNVTWYLNSVIVKDTEKSVTQATYTNTSASMGVWNVSAVAKNANGNIMQTWTWNVTSTPVSPSIIAFDPVSVQVNDIAGQLRTFNISLNQPVNVTWYLNSVIVKDTEKSVTQATYTNTSASMGVWNVSAVAKNANGNIMQTWTWNVTSTPVSPSIIAFDPVSVQVNDIAGQLRTFNISLNQPVNVTWYLNSVIVKDTEKSVTQATYTNTSASMGVWNVSAVAKNANGNIMQTWTWNV